MIIETAKNIIAVTLSTLAVSIVKEGFEDC
jgi:hypothetical protein